MRVVPRYHPSMKCRSKRRRSAASLDAKIRTQFAQSRRETRRLLKELSQDLEAEIQRTHRLSQRSLADVSTTVDVIAAELQRQALSKQTYREN